MCDTDLYVHFDKQRYYVYKEYEEWIITRTRTSNNYYQMNMTVDLISMNIHMHDMELWHKKLSHVKFLYNLGQKRIVRGI